MLLVGSYSSDGDNKSLYKLNYTNKELAIIGRIESGLNPSFILPDSNKTILINEIESATNLRVIDNRGKTVLQTRGGGVGPCHINKFHDCIAISNYTSGSLSLLKDNRVVDSYKFSGSGPNIERQEGSHVHSSIFNSNNNTLYSVDLGRDSIDRFKIVESKLNYIGCFKLQPGDGPRMMAINGNLGYIVNELSNSVTVVEILKDGTLRESSRYSTLPESYKGQSYASHIEIVNNKVYISNRGYDSIVVFTIYGDKLINPMWIELNGSFPRHFLIDDDTLFTANQESNDIEVRDLNTGEFITSVEIHKPTIVVKVL